MRQATPRDLAQWFGHFHAPVPTLLDATPDNALIWGDLHDLRPITQYAFGHVALLGDAAHATTPNMGQGACMAIEDAVVLARCMALAADQPAQALQRYQSLRMQRTHWVVNTSWRLGQMAHWRNPLATALRNTAIRLTPSDNIIHKLHGVQLEVA